MNNNVVVNVFGEPQNRKVMLSAFFAEINFLDFNAEIFNFKNTVDDTDIVCRYLKELSSSASKVNILLTDGKILKLVKDTQKDSSEALDSIRSSINFVMLDQPGIVSYFKDNSVPFYAIAKEKHCVPYAVEIMMKGIFSA